ncbi:MAG TPA: hypothetical protein VFG62_26605, partial [Rhodopila sp.]|nr:hypothetical protein [Rhodopila sp.]
MVWFALNYELYDLRKGGPYFGFSDSLPMPVPGPVGGVGLNRGGHGTRPHGTLPPVEIAGFDQGTWAPPRLSAIEILIDEFGETLPRATLRDIAGQLPGEWMQRTDLEPIAPATPPSGDVYNLLRSDFARLESLVRGIKTRPVDGPSEDMRGHNNPPDDDAPPTGEETEAILQNIGEAQAAIAEGAPPNVGRLKAAWLKLSPILLRLGAWGLKQIDNFVTNFTTEAGKSLARTHTYLLISGAVGVWHVAQN